MRFTDLRDDTLPTGRLCIWVPTAEARARAERAPRDLRRTSHNQERHLTRALASRVDPGLLGAVEFDGASRGLRPGELGSLLLKSAAEHGVLLRAMGDTVVFAPPLISNASELETIVERFAAAHQDTVSAAPRGPRRD